MSVRGVGSLHMLTAIESLEFLGIHNLKKNKDEGEGSSHIIEIALQTSGLGNPPQLLPTRFPIQCAMTKG